MSTGSSDHDNLIHNGDICVINRNYEWAVKYYSQAMGCLEQMSPITRFRLISHNLGASLIMIHPKILDESISFTYEKEASDSEASRLHQLLEDAKKTTADIDKLVLLNGELEMFHFRMAQCYLVLKKPCDALNSLNKAIDHCTSEEKIQTYLQWRQRYSVNVEEIHTVSPLILGSPSPPKYQYYQSDSIVTIAILEPNLTQEQLHLSFEGEQDEIIRVVMTKNGYHVTVLYGRLFDLVDSSKTKIKFFNDKCLIKLKKIDIFEWQDLFGQTKDGKKSKTLQSQSDRRKVEKLNKPYSSSKDWNEIERSLDEETEKPQGEEALNQLFRDIYGKADENTRRAMVKSFQTSGGTVLSTNWDEVSKKDYEKERQAPKGMEWKNWEGTRLE